MKIGTWLSDMTLYFTFCILPELISAPVVALLLFLVLGFVIAHAGLQLLISPPQLPECLDYRHLSVSFCFVNVVSISLLLKEPGSIELRPALVGVPPL